MISLYNSLSRQKEAFVPLTPSHVKMYACGPTVYNYAHIGNARMAVVFDVWARLLRRHYPKVTYASNITDVEDKIITAAQEQGVPISTITEKYTRIYNEDMASLNVLPPDIQPKATNHIIEMIVLIEQLITRGHAYAAEGHVLFHVPSDPSYGALSGRSRDEQIAGARVDVAPYKRDPADFVLWKPSTVDQPGWESPFGFGRPGWHIECSAMAEKHLGLPFDIHGGGADLKFPHHENEIAQSCCAHGIADNVAGFAKYWLHNGFVTVEGEKMSKSLGNVLLVHDLIASHQGEVLRLALLSAHYRQPLDWGAQCIHQAQALLDKVYAALAALEDGANKTGGDDTLSDCPQTVMTALCDDLNTPLALAEIHKILKEKSGEDLKRALHGIGNLLGLFQQSPTTWLSDGKPALSDQDRVTIETLIQDRNTAKAAKNFALADDIRHRLEEMGIEIKDTRYGTTWVQR